MNETAVKIIEDYFNNYSKESYFGRRRLVETIFKNFRQITDTKLKNALETILESDKVLCEKLSDSQLYRSHEIFIKMYIDDTHRTAKEIARSKYMSVNTVYRDVEQTFERLTILIFGLYGLKI